MSGDIFGMIEDEIKNNLIKGGNRIMYFSKDEEVEKVMDEIIDKNDEMKLKLIIYLYYQIKNNHMNSKNSIELFEDDLDILTKEILGIEDNDFEMLLDSLLKYLSEITNIKYNVANEYILNINYNDKDIYLQRRYEKLNFMQKLDLIAELFIRLGNNTMFENKNEIIEIQDGFSICRNIMDYKNNL